MSGDTFYVRMGTTTPEQDAIRERTYEAAKVLREAGFDCEVIEWFVTKPGEHPAGIVLK